MSLGRGGGVRWPREAESGGESTGHTNGRHEVVVETRGPGPVGPRGGRTLPAAGSAERVPAPSEAHRVTVTVVGIFSRDQGNCRGKPKYGLIGIER